MDVGSLGPTMIGAVIGWTVYYFMRQFSLFSPIALIGTIGAFMGGPVLKYMSPEAFGGRIQSLYFTGVAIVFFVYATYLATLLILKARGSITEDDFNFYASSGPGQRFKSKSERDFVEVMSSVRKYREGNLDATALKRKVRKSRLKPKHSVNTISQ